MRRRGAGPGGSPSPSGSSWCAPMAHPGTRDHSAISARLLAVPPLPGGPTVQQVPSAPALATWSGATRDAAQPLPLLIGCGADLDGLIAGDPRAYEDCRRRLTAAA